MSVLNPNSEEEAQECPLCLEFLELDDINFYPCACGYQICRFCWNKIRTEGSGLCPACRSPYTENPADFKPLTPEELAKIKAEKRQKDQAKKQKISENRKHLANVRVVQKNLVFVVGLSPRLSDPEILRKPEYFGKFGKIHKVVINHSTSYAGNQSQGPSASAYVTYFKSEDALRAIQAVNNIYIDGRTLKASLGTTKYCSHFMKNQSCPKHECMYLHELGDDAASFTKEEMQQGKHTDYERQLHEEIEGGNNSVSSKASILDTTTKTSSDQISDNGETKQNGVNSPTENLFNSDVKNSIQSDAREKKCDMSNETEKQEQNLISPTAGSLIVDEDDLGFDPFQETQKALAELLESESKLLQQKSPVEQSLQPLDSNINSAFSSLSFQPPQKTPIVRQKAPPPGFNLTSLLPGTGESNFEPHQTGASSKNTNGWHQKDWQDGLRALLPNVNVSFESNVGRSEASKIQEFHDHRFQTESSTLFGTVGSNMQREDLTWSPQQNSYNDWTVLDPAIVSGQMSNQHKRTADSPSSWIRNNLDRLTSESPNSTIVSSMKSLVDESSRASERGREYSNFHAPTMSHNNNPLNALSHPPQSWNLSGQPPSFQSAAIGGLPPPPPGFSRGEVPSSTFTKAQTGGETNMNSDSGHPYFGKI